MRIPALLFILTLITLCTAAQAPPAPPRKPAAARLARKLLCSKCHLNVRATSASSQPATTLPTCLDPLGYFTTLLQTCGIFKIEVTPSGLLSISSTLGSQQYYLHIDRRGDLRGSTGYGELVLADAVFVGQVLQVKGSTRFKLMVDGAKPFSVRPDPKGGHEVYWSE